MTALVLAGLLILLPNQVYAAAGDLDTSFGTGGIVITDFGLFAQEANAIVIQSDGKIIAGGSIVSLLTGSGDFALARYNPNGTLDTTFGSGGKVTTDFGGRDDRLNAVAMQSDGKIVAAGTTFAYSPDSSFFALARYNTDGSLDTGFGTGGKVTTDILNARNVANAVAIQPDGKIVAAGRALFVRAVCCFAQFVFALARYNTDGSLDTSFGTGGTVAPSPFIINPGVEANVIAIQPDGKIVAVGSGDNLGNNLAVARYNTNGSFDTSFGSGGIVSTFVGRGVARAVALQSDGKIVAAGTILVGHPFTQDDDFAVVRYNTNGSLDTSFGTSGIVTTDFGIQVQPGLQVGLDEGRGVAIQSDGKIVVAGRDGRPGSFFGLVRYNTDGSLDTSFGSGGKVSTDPGGGGEAHAVAIQTDGKIVAAGLVANQAPGFHHAFALVRYQGGVTDTTPPVTTATLSPPANGNGWNNANVSVTLSATDNAGGSGVRQITSSATGAQAIAPTTVLGASAVIPVTNEGITTLNFFAADNAGNVEAPKSATVKLDKTLPTITASRAPVANLAGWNNANVTVGFACSDALSGVFSCSGPATLSAEGANQSAQGSATDFAGNQASVTQGGINIDKTPPSITITTPPSGAIYLLNQTVTANYGCTDSLSGIASCVGPVANGASVNTATVGANNFAVNASDVAGNNATQTNSYAVQYNFVGFLQPLVNSPTINVVSSGRTIPIKWQLLDANGAFVSALGSFVSLLTAPIACDASSPSTIVSQQLGAPGDTVVRYDATANQFIFNWQTFSGWAGSCRELQLTLADGTRHFGKFSFR